MSHEENKVDSPESIETAHKNSQKSVMHYLLVLFAAAFCLLLLTLLMEQRTNDELVDKMYEQVDFAQTRQTQIATLHDELEVEMELAQAQIAELELTLQQEQSSAQATQSALQEELVLSQESITALNRLRDIQLAYACEQYAQARLLIVSFQEEGLPAVLENHYLNNLSMVDAAGTDFSYQTMVSELFPDGVPALEEGLF